MDHCKKCRSVLEERKIELLDNLSIAVEKIQSEFDNPLHNKQVKDGKTTQFLCACLEDIFQHGLKDRTFYGPSSSPEKLSFWPVIQKLSMKEDIQTIYRLSIIQTDINRCRAWMRMKLKDHTVGSYIGLLTDDNKILKEFYGSTAFLRDTVKVESVKTLLQYVIANLDFQISVEGTQAPPKSPSPLNMSSPGPVIVDSILTNNVSSEPIRRRSSNRRRIKTPTSNIAPIKDSGEANGTVVRTRRSSLNSKPDVKANTLTRSKTYHRARSTEPRLENSELGENTSDMEQPKELLLHKPKTVRPNVVDLPSTLSIEGDGVEKHSFAAGTQIRQPKSATLNDNTFLRPDSLNLHQPNEGNSTFDKSEITQRKKDEINGVLRDLKLNRNRPLPVEQILDIIPRQDGLSENELKRYLEECMNDYFSMEMTNNKAGGILLKKQNSGSFIEDLVARNDQPEIKVSGDNHCTGNAMPDVTSSIASVSDGTVSVDNAKPDVTSVIGNTTQDVKLVNGNPKAASSFDLLPVIPSSELGAATISENSFTDVTTLEGCSKPDVTKSGNSDIDLSSLDRRSTVNVTSLGRSSGPDVTLKSSRTDVALLDESSRIDVTLITGNPGTDVTPNIGNIQPDVTSLVDRSESTTKIDKQDSKCLSGLSSGDIMFKKEDSITSNTAKSTGRRGTLPVASSDTSKMKFNSVKDSEGIIRTLRPKTSNKKGSVSLDPPGSINSEEYTEQIDRFLNIIKSNTTCENETAKPHPVSSIDAIEGTLMQFTDEASEKASQDSTRNNPSLNVNTSIGDVLVGQSKVGSEKCLTDDLVLPGVNLKYKNENDVDSAILNSKNDKNSKYAIADDLILQHTNSESRRDEIMESSLPNDGKISKGDDLLPEDFLPRPKNLAPENNMDAVKVLMRQPKMDDEGTTDAEPSLLQHANSADNDSCIGDSASCTKINMKNSNILLGAEDSVLRDANTESKNVEDIDKALIRCVMEDSTKASKNEDSMSHDSVGSGEENAAWVKELDVLEEQSDKVFATIGRPSTLLAAAEIDESSIGSDAKSFEDSLVASNEETLTELTQSYDRKRSTSDNDKKLRLKIEATENQNKASSRGLSFIGNEPDDFNFVPGIYEESPSDSQSKTRSVQNRRSNTIDGTDRRALRGSPHSISRASSSRSYGSEAVNRGKQRLSACSDNQDILYGFRVNSPSVDSPHSSVNTTQGLMFDDGNYASDSETETYDSAGTEDQERIRNILADLGVNDDIVGLKEDHFSTPDSFMGFTSGEELQNAIESCKERIKSLPPSSDDHKQLVKKLVQLRLKLHEQKEAPMNQLAHVKKILGHQFATEGKASGNYFCDSCGSTIWAFVHNLYKCIDCSFYSHKKCLNAVDKPCVSKKISGSMYITNIAPESGLATQQYRCADCRRRLLFREGYFEARICDYTGQFYCSNCHWNETQVMPARVIHNWDFVPRKISRQSKHLLNLLSGKPIICLKELNPALFNFVEDLRDVKALREQILKMKGYLVSCRLAVQDRLLLLLKERQHFVENPDVYTLQDLIGVYSGELLEDLSRITATFGKHIKFDCVLCQGKGFICEICRSSDVIFPFDFNAHNCEKCKATFHRACLRRENCPKCIRIAKRKDKG